MSQFDERGVEELARRLWLYGEGRRAPRNQDGPQSLQTMNDLQTMAGFVLTLLADEREACGKIADDVAAANTLNGDSRIARNTAIDIATAIRARSKR